MAAHLTSVFPSRAVEGGRVTLRGGFSVGGPRLPEVRIGGLPARVVRASSTALSVLVPEGLEGGATSVRVDPDGPDLRLDVGSVLATGLHQVDSPVFDAEGNLYVTYSGIRGQEVPVSIFRVSPAGQREPFVAGTGIVNPTSMVFGPSGVLYVSSRFAGTVFRVTPDGEARKFATELGVTCGLAFRRDGGLYAGDRSGTVFLVDRTGQVSVFATLPASVAAFHLAVAPDDTLYVTAPTMGSYDRVYRLDQEARSSVVSAGFGRPQGLAFDDAGALFVVDALAGASGLYRVGLTEDPASVELVVAAPMLVGVAFGPGGRLVVASGETVYQFA